MVTLISRSPEETLAIGQAWGSRAATGWIIGLSGDLGAGKTQLVRGLAAGLGSPARVHSPTFTLVNEYSGGRLVLTHLDLYRLEGAAALRSAGLEDHLLAPQGVVVVEWFERWLEAGLPLGTGPVRRVRLTTQGEQEREIAYDDSGT
jgi:tRNA threonylcarbamoyladenosine biosynthesis protein TsaE